MKLSPELKQLVPKGIVNPVDDSNMNITMEPSPSNLRNVVKGDWTDGGGDQRMTIICFLFYPIVKEGVVEDIMPNQEQIEVRVSIPEPFLDIKVIFDRINNKKYMDIMMVTMVWYHHLPRLTRGTS